MTTAQTYLTRASCYLQRSCDMGIDEALKDVAFADKLQSEKKNEISKLRVNIRKAKQRLLVLANRADQIKTINKEGQSK